MRGLQPEANIEAIITDLEPCQSYENSAPKNGFCSHQSEHKHPVIPPEFRSGKSSGDKAQSYRKGCGDHQSNSRAVNVRRSVFMVGFGRHVWCATEDDDNVEARGRHAIVLVRMDDDIVLVTEGGMYTYWIN